MLRQGACALEPVADVHASTLVLFANVTKGCSCELVLQAGPGSRAGELMHAARMLLCCMYAGVCLPWRPAAETVISAGHSATQPLARSSLHASNTLALGCMPAGNYQLSFPCRAMRAGSCQSHPAALHITKHASAHSAKREAQELAVHVLRPTIQVLHAGCFTQKSSMNAYKTLLQGCLVLLSLGLQAQSAAQV